MRAWYDILGLGRLSKQDVSGIEEADRSVQALIHQQEQAGIPAERIVLAGFSQGGAMALYTGVRYPRRLAGILALSTYLPLADTLPPPAHSCPILMIHGTEDFVVSLDLGEHSRAYLEKLHYNVEWLTYPMGHSVCPEEIEHIRGWLQRIGL
jgi:phospholipase/carboxylesterase